MTYRGHVKNGAVVLDVPVTLSEGTKVEVAVVESAEPTREAKSVWELAAEISASVPLEDWDRMPTDASMNLDHYLYGSPKCAE
jgi:hypothetical protein